MTSMGICPTTHLRHASYATPPMKATPILPVVLAHVEANEPNRFRPAPRASSGNLDMELALTIRLATYIGVGQALRQDVTNRDQAHGFGMGRKASLCVRNGKSLMSCLSVGHWRQVIVKSLLSTGSTTRKDIRQTTADGLRVRSIHRIGISVSSFQAEKQRLKLPSDWVCQPLQLGVD